MSSPGLAKITGDPDATVRTDRALRRLGRPENVVTGNGVFINDEGQIALRPGTDATPIRSTTSATTLTSADYTLNVTSGTFTQPLPTAVGISGKIYVIKNSGAGTVTVDAAGVELIDGALTATVAAGGALRIQSTNSGWIVI